MLTCTVTVWVLARCNLFYAAVRSQVSEWCVCQIHWRIVDSQGHNQKFISISVFSCTFSPFAFFPILSPFPFPLFPHFEFWGCSNTQHIVLVMLWAAKEQLISWRRMLRLWQQHLEKLHADEKKQKRQAKRKERKQHCKNKKRKKMTLGSESDKETSSSSDDDDDLDKKLKKVWPIVVSYCSIFSNFSWILFALSTSFYLNRFMFDRHRAEEKSAHFVLRHSVGSYSVDTGAAICTVKACFVTRSFYSRSQQVL